MDGIKLYVQFTVFTILFTACKIPSESIPFSTDPKRGTHIISLSRQFNKKAYNVSVVHQFNDSLQRHFFTAYAVLSNFTTVRYSYHIASVNYHSDSVDLTELSKLIMHDERGIIRIKRKNKGKYVIRCKWKDDGMHRIFMHGHPKKNKILIPTDTLYALNQTELYSNHLLIQHYNPGYLYTSLGRYTEVTILMDTLLFMASGYTSDSCTLNSMVTRLYNTRSGKQVKDLTYSFLLTDKKTSIVPGKSYLTKPELKLSDNTCLHFENPEFNQEIHTMKWAVWLGFSKIVVTDSCDVTARMIKNRKAMGRLLSF